MRSYVRRFRSVAFALIASACGGDPGAESPPAPEPSAGAEVAAPRAGGMEVTGLMGTIPEREVHRALDPKMGSLQRCFARGAQQFEWIGGAMEFYFRVAADGRVQWVIPRASSVGHRETERCLLEVARGTRFPAPRGGDAAEFAWGFEIDVAEDVRPPVAWDAVQVQPVVAEQRAALEACGLANGALNVTAYVAPGGSVLAAGAAVESVAVAEQIDCALAAIAGWQLPDPGSYPAKVSFAAP